MSGRAAKAVFGVAGVLLISRLLGFVREIVIADIFGTSAQYDMYLLAIMLPALAYGVLNFASIYLFVPYLSRKMDASSGDDPSARWSDVWPATNMAVLTAFGVAAAIALLAPLLMRIWADNYLAADFDTIVFYCRLMAIMVVLGTTEAFMRAFLNVKRIFTYPAAGYIVFNVFCVLAIIVLNRQLSVGAIALGWLGGLFVQNLYLLARILSFKPFEKFVRTVFNKDTSAILATGSILIIIELINRSYFLIDRYIAPKFGEGVISALNYSQVVIQLPDSIIGLAIGAVVFPMFSQASGDSSERRFGDVYQKAVTGALFLAVPIAAFFFVNAGDLVYLLFHRGQFDMTSVQLTTTVLKPFTPSIVALFVISTSIRACYSGGWAKQVFIFAVIIFITKYAATILLPQWMGYAGITVATTIAHVGFAAFMTVFLTRRVPATDKPRFVFNVIMLLVVGVLAAAVTNYSNSLIAPLFTAGDIVDTTVKLVVSGLILLIVYWLCISFLGMRKMFTVYLARSSGEKK
jgi:putative peptidoglycan lipid II flippase